MTNTQHHRAMRQNAYTTLFEWGNTETGDRWGLPEATNTERWYGAVAKNATTLIRQKNDSETENTSASVARMKEARYI